MAINFSTDSTLTITKPPRIVTVADTLAGCPGTRSNPIMTITFTTSSVAGIIIEGEIIRRRQGTGRCDTALYGPGYPSVGQDAYTAGTQLLDYTLDYNDGYDNEWDNACFRWMGYAQPGTLTFYLNNATSGCESLWGCGSTWGRLSAIIFE